jgi:alpha-tubulin suppressor-like RCC1 family protein
MIHLDKPTQVYIESGDKTNQKIKNISASGYNSAAFAKDGKLWVWGGVSRGKMGLN